MIVGRIQYPVQYWIEGLSFLLPIGRHLPSVHCCVVLSSMATTFSKTVKEWVFALDRYTVSCIITAEVTSLHISCILLVKSKSSVLVQRKGLWEDMNSRRLCCGSNLRVCPLQRVECSGKEMLYVWLDAVHFCTFPGVWSRYLALNPSPAFSQP